MITQFQKYSYRWSPAAVLTILAVACLALPSAHQCAATAGDQPTGLAAVPPPAAKPSVTMRLVQTQVWDDMSLSTDGRYLCGCRTWAEPKDEITIRTLATDERRTLKPTKPTPQ